MFDVIGLCTLDKDVEKGNLFQIFEQQLFLFSLLTLVSLTLSEDLVSGEIYPVEVKSGTGTLVIIPENAQNETSDRKIEAWGSMAGLRDCILYRDWNPGGQGLARFRLHVGQRVQRLAAPLRQLQGAVHQLGGLTAVTDADGRGDAPTVPGDPGERAD